MQHMVEYYNLRWSELVGNGKGPGVSAVHPLDYAEGRRVCNGRTDAEVESIVDAYLSLPDPKLREQGYPFRWLYTRLAQVLAAGAAPPKRNDEDWND